MELITALTTLGLTEKAAQVYVTGLELGTASIQALAVKTSIKRTTIYSVVDELKAFDLVTETAKGKKRLFAFVHPNQLKVLENQRAAALERSWDTLQRLAAESPGRPQITYASTLPAIQKLYESAVRTATTDTIGIADSKTADALGEEWLLRYIQKRNQCGIAAQTLLTDSAKAQVWQQKDFDDNRALRLLDKKHQLPINIEVVGDTTIITSLEGECLGLAIESTKIATGMREILDMVWEATTD